MKNYTSILSHFCFIGALLVSLPMNADVLDDAFDWKRLQGSKLGYYIGSFDPIHLGHQNVIEQALESKAVDFVLIYPAPGGDQYKNRTDLALRQKMIASVYNDHPKVLITYWTPKELQNKFALFAEGIEIIGVIGSDVVTEVLLGPDKLLSEKYHTVFMRGIPIQDKHSQTTVGALMALKANSFIVALRGDVDLSNLKAINDRPICAFIQSQDHSSTKVRNAVQNKQPFEEYLSSSVVKIIKQEGLYGLSSD